MSSPSFSPFRASSLMFVMTFDACWKEGSWITWLHWVCGGGIKDNAVELLSPPPPLRRDPFQLGAVPFADSLVPWGIGSQRSPWLFLYEALQLNCKCRDGSLFIPGPCDWFRLGELTWQQSQIAIAFFSEVSFIVVVFCFSLSLRVCIRRALLGESGRPSGGHARFDRSGDFPTFLARRTATSTSTRRRRSFRRSSRQSRQLVLENCLVASSTGNITKTEKSASKEKLYGSYGRRFTA